MGLLTLNGTCNSTLDEMRIGSSEIPMVGTMTFHTIGLIVAAACAFIAILLSFYLIWMHALHYTKPYEQRHIIRILFMIPTYAAASFLQFYYYWHAVYFQVICDCYEAFAIASFFALLCHYIAPDLHEQKMYFRSIEPKPWVWPITWFKSCCCGQRGPWRTPRSGLTWFNIIWTGVYHYCFIRVSMTVTAVVTQYFGKYCESSNSPVFAHIWILVIESVAVTIAMYCLIQFYVQLRHDLAPHSPFLKVLAIKLVIFLSFWQSFMISILTSSTFNLVSPTAKIAYPDLKVGIPSLLLCIEMALFAVLHLFAFSWKPYASSASGSDYPMSPIKNSLGPKQGGFLGIKAFVDAMNPWDLVKAFARGMRWLFIGVKHRENDTSYKSSSFDINNPQNGDMSLQSTTPASYKRTQNLPIAEEFRRSKFGMPGFASGKKADDEGAGLIAHAQPHPLNTGSSGYVPARQRYDINGQDISSGGTVYNTYNPDRSQTPAGDIGMAITKPPEPYQSHVVQPYTPQQPSEAYLDEMRQDRRKQQTPSEQWANSTQPLDAEDARRPVVHNALWGGQNQQSSQQSPNPYQQHHQNQF
ncbi:organic solute transporter Ostalpha-domain-containing protein [Leptodontidium sp. 2 PMI_412]|nr:organic solute transporter Ostalpha-domain-containing protein [Leptodontidium sp. MPI-SDFR-AT-0119]KAH9209508.1 organic solute transporter Ostalpha-domain-containing protein [Leptodontidium sp. 2 PMI_412]